MLQVQTYQTNRQTSGQHTTKKFAANGYCAKVSACGITPNTNDSPLHPLKQLIP